MPFRGSYGRIIIRPNVFNSLCEKIKNNNKLCTEIVGYPLLSKSVMNVRTSGKNKA